MSILPIKIKLNSDLRGYKAGTILTINPEHDLYWRRRIGDAEYDNCLEILTKKTEKAEKTEIIENTDKIEKIKQKQEIKHKSVDKSVDKL